MPSELPLIIQQLESERLRLERAIKACVQESDYAFANLHQAGLIQVNRRLRIYRHLHGPSALLLAKARRQFQNLHAARGRPGLGEMDEYRELVATREAELTARIAALERKSTDIHTDGDELLSVLEALLNHTITEARLRIPEHLLLELIREANRLELTVKYLGEWQYSTLTVTGGAGNLRKLGFDVSATSARLSIADLSSVTPYDLLVLLSAVVYDGFYSEQMPEATLEY